MARTRARSRTQPAFGRWLRQLRESAGLTQDALAAAIGTDRRNIRRWEREGHDPSATTLLRILDAVGAEIVPSPPREFPRALNAELHELRTLVYEADDAAASRHDELLARLDEQAHAIRALSARRARST